MSATKVAVYAERILRAKGTSLKNYMPSSQTDILNAVSSVMQEVEADVRASLNAPSLTGDTHSLIKDLWWFIENVNEDSKDRADRFFSLRERVREAL
ncbi:hypothetical protein [Methylobacterium aquaticum]|uniref:hypothetical protein n=1 Tax=Methylobacterium aquaticum TaxID=270351 RepID=UPI0019333F73|nr:hypothetical protein [Methylobacterium aquaticum]QRE77000.1 hypothetical protein F1D61_28705 [Methylobacterium aquaticum]